MNEETKQKLVKLIKVVTKILPLFVVFFFLALLPLPHVVRLVGFVASLVFVAFGFIVTGVLIVLLVKQKDKIDEKVRKIMWFLAIASPVADVLVLVLLLFLVYPSI